MKKHLLALITRASLCSLFGSTLLTATLVPCSANAQVPNYVPTNGLVGWWPFNGNAQDESGNGNNGTVNGATLTADRFGNVDEAYSFDGVQSFIEMNIPQTLSFSLSTWFNPSILTTGILGIIQHKDNCTRGAGYIIEIQNSSIRYQASNCGQCGNICPNYYDFPNVFNSNINQWYHMILTCDNNGLYNLFIDNNLIHTTTNASTLCQFNVPFSVGKHHDGTDLYYFNGKIDDIGLWNRALTDVEITALYNGCSNLISSQPTVQTVTLSAANSAQFSVTSTATSPIYQWQTNLGVGFQNISDAGQYSGTATSTLTVSNLTVANNHNQQFRCLVTDGSCADTTDIAVLTVIDDLGIEDLQPNASKNLVKITDLNGKETAFRKNTVLLFIYDDGTVERVFEVE
jgi:hypothetical protein